PLPLFSKNTHTNRTPSVTRSNANAYRAARPVPAGPSGFALLDSRLSLMSSFMSNLSYAAGIASSKRMQVRAGPRLSFLQVYTPGEQTTVAQALDAFGSSLPLAIL